MTPRTIVTSAAAALAAAAACMPATGTPLGVGLALDGPSDAPFDRLAIAGAMRAERAGAARVQVMRPATEGTDPALLDALADSGNQLVIAVGYRWAEHMAAAARRHPGTDFAVVDASSGTARAEGLGNVRGILFREDQAGRLAGYLAALDAREKGGPVVLGAVGGMRIPPVQRYVTGFRSGARLGAPRARVIVRYSGSFVGGAGCGRIATRMASQGAHAVFAAAGPCGDDALRAAARSGRGGIGVDTDQSSLGPHMLTSAVKRVDIAVRDTIDARSAGRLAGGDVRYGIAERGVGLGPIAPSVSPAVRVQVAALARRMGAPTGR